MIKNLSTQEYLNPSDVNYVIKVVKKAEKNCFNIILVPMCDKCLDPFVLTGSILQNTKSHRVVIAILVFEEFVHCLNNLMRLKEPFSFNGDMINFESANIVSPIEIQ